MNASDSNFHFCRRQFVESNEDCWFKKIYVGSFYDSDGLARDGLTSNAFWVLSDLLIEDTSLRDVILATCERLASS